MRHDRPFETCLDAAASAWMAGCTAFALATGMETLGGTSSVALSPGGSVIAALLTFRLLQKVERAAVALPHFELAPLEALVPATVEEPEGELLLSDDMALPLPELLLGRAHTLDPRESGDDQELLLDDVLVQPRPNSRVVQLFDPSRMPTAGELHARIDRHLRLERKDPSDPQADASQALYDALADLRRSLA